MNDIHDEKIRLDIFDDKHIWPDYSTLSPKQARKFSNNYPNMVKPVGWTYQEDSLTKEFNNKQITVVYDPEHLTIDAFVVYSSEIKKTPKQQIGEHKVLFKQRWTQHDIEDFDGAIMEYFKSPIIFDNSYIVDKLHNLEQYANVTKN